MSFSTETLNTLYQTLQLCSQPSTMQIGEAQLRNLNMDPQYPLLLLELLTRRETSIEILLRAAIEFKLSVSRTWVSENEYELSQSSIAQAIRQKIIQVLYQSDPKVQLQISEALIKVAQLDFPIRWQTLIQELTSPLSPENLQTNKIAFYIIKKICKKYEYASRSDPLYIEIIQMTDDIHLALFNYIKDLPQQIDDNLNNWVGLLQYILKIQVVFNQEDLEILLVKIKGEVIRSLLLFVTKYREDFTNDIQTFSQQIWDTCMKTKNNPQYEKINLNAIKYFTHLMGWNEMNEFFKSSIGTLMEVLIMPHLGLTQADTELYEEEPSNFVDTFFENGDSNKIRQKAGDLLKTMSRLFPQETGTFIQKFLMEYQGYLQSGKPELPDKEVLLINILIEALTHSFRPKDGVTNIYLDAAYVNFFVETVLKAVIGKLGQAVSSNIDTQLKNIVNPVQLAFHLRFMFYFRNYLNKGDILEICKIISFALTKGDETLKKAACRTIEGLITIQIEIPQTFAIKQVPNYFTKDNIQPQIQIILQNIYHYVKNTQIENYSLKCLNVIINIMQETTCTFADAFGDLYKDVLAKILKGFQFESAQYIFEGLGGLIYYNNANPQSIKIIEQYTEQALNDIVQKSQSSLFSFVLQIFAIRLRGSDKPSPNHKVILQSLLLPNNWNKDHISYFPAYTIFLEEYIQKDTSFAVQHAANIQSIMQILLNEKLDQIFFNFAESILKSMDLLLFRSSGWLAYILNLIFQSASIQGLEAADAQLGKPKLRLRPHFTKSAVCFVSDCILKYTFSEFFKECEAVRQGALFEFLLFEINFICFYQKKPERRHIIVAFSELLLNMNNFQLIQPDIWKQLFNSLIQNMYNRRYKRSAIYVGLEDEGLKVKGNVMTGSKTSFHKISYLTTKGDTLAEQIPDEEKYFLNKFQQFYQSTNGQINLSQLILPEYQNFFEELLKKV